MVDYCPRPSASDNSPPWSSSSPRGNSFDYLPKTHEITVYYLDPLFYMDTMAVQRQPTRLKTTKMDSINKRQHRVNTCLGKTFHGRGKVFLDRYMYLHTIYNLILILSAFVVLSGVGVFWITDSMMDTFDLNLN